MANVRGSRSPRKEDQITRINSHSHREAKARALRVWGQKGSDSVGVRVRAAVGTKRTSPPPARPWALPLLRRSRRTPTRRERVC
eukprot:3906608-Pleurochrysis_carterae.AAC.4